MSIVQRGRQWLIERFLPAYARVSLWEDYERQQRRIAALEQENDRLRAYIAGLETGLHAQRRIIIKTGGDTA